MMRLAWIAGFIAGVTGLQTHDEPLALYGSRAKISGVSALDPDLINIAGETFHVTQAGTYVMTGFPDSSCNPEFPDTTCTLIIFANFEKMENDSDCNDLMIRNVTIQGTFLDNLGAGPGSGVTKIDFSTLNDVANSSDNYMGFQVNDEYKSRVDFFNQVIACTIQDPIGYFAYPNRHTNRFRTKTHFVECDFNLGQHKVEVQFGVVFRGNSMDTGLPVYANDIAKLSVGNVPNDTIGLLGRDDHSAQTVAVPGCNKNQPVMGPYQTRHGPKFPKRHRWR